LRFDSELYQINSLVQENVGSIQTGYFKVAAADIFQQEKVLRDGRHLLAEWSNFLVQRFGEQDVLGDVQIRGIAARSS